MYEVNKMVINNKNIKIIWVSDRRRHPENYMALLKIEELKQEDTIDLLTWLTIKQGWR